MDVYEIYEAVLQVHSQMNVILIPMLIRNLRMNFSMTTYVE